MKKISLALLLGLASLTFAHAQTAPPQAPTGITATFIVPSQISLSWTPPVNVPTLAGYHIYRNGVPIADTGGNSYVDTVPFGSFTYTVAAYTTDGTTSNQSSPSAPVMVTQDTTPPTPPANLTATMASTSSITLSWGASTDNVGVVGYTIYRNREKLNADLVSGNSYTDSSGLIPNYVYYYSVTAYDASRNVSNAATATILFDVTPPSVPLGLGSHEIGGTWAVISWSASQDNVLVKGYRLSRNGSQIADVASTSFRDTGLATSTAYSYTVIAYDPAGNISDANNATVTTMQYDPLPPATNTPIVLPLVSQPVILSPTTPPANQNKTVTQTNVLLTTNLYLGMRGDAVKALQGVLVRAGFLGANAATGYYGQLTLKAVQAFQCKQNVVCSGGPWTTGWGTVGTKTRKALNGF